MSVWVMDGCCCCCYNINTRFQFILIIIDYLCEFNLIYCRGDYRDKDLVWILNYLFKPLGSMKIIFNICINVNFYGITLPQSYKIPSPYLNIVLLIITHFRFAFLPMNFTFAKKKKNHVPLPNSVYS